MDSRKNKVLRRYTSLPILLDMLVNKKITLVDPFSWEDRNDAFCLEQYRKRKKLKTVLVACFTTKPETFHHWKVFAGNPGGVCIRFDKNKLVDCFGRSSQMRTGLVTYMFMKDLNHKTLLLNKLPFLKRKQYEDDREFRILYENKKKVFQTKNFDLNLGCIKLITLSPWMPFSAYETVKRMIHDIPGCSLIKIVTTGVIDSSKWKKSLGRTA